MAIDKKINYNKPIVQGGVDNYLGKQPQVQAPRKWQSSPDKPATELAYITEAEKDLILKSNIHGGLEGGPNMGPSGIMSLDSFGDVGGGGASGGDTSAGGGANEGASFSGQGGGESPADFKARVAKETAVLQNAENIQARDLGYKARENIANATYGPLQEHTGERGFLGNLFRGANKYGYTDTYTSGPNQGQVKPGWGGRILGGLAGLATGIPFVGGAIGSVIDKGKGIFGRKPRDMSQFNRLGLGGTQPGTYDFDPNAQIQANSFKQPENYVENLINSIDDSQEYQAGTVPFDPSFGPEYNPTTMNPSMMDLDEIGRDSTGKELDYIGYSPAEKIAIAAGAKTPELGDLTDYINIDANKSAMERYLNSPMKPTGIETIDIEGIEDHSAKLGTLQTKEYETLKMGKELGMNTPEQNKKLDILEKLKNEASLRSETAIV